MVDIIVTPSVSSVLNLIYTLKIKITTHIHVMYTQKHVSKQNMCSLTHNNCVCNHPATRGFTGRSVGDHSFSSLKMKGDHVQ